jgi:hypothetical protein
MTLVRGACAYQLLLQFSYLLTYDAAVVYLNLDFGFELLLILQYKALELLVKMFVVARAHFSTIFRVCALSSVLATSEI